MTEHFQTTARRDGKGPTARQRAELMKALRIYHPPHTGIHICGSDDEKNAAMTLGAFPMSEVEARAAFETMKGEFSEPGGDCDVVVDLCVRGDIVDDFGMRRQMIERLRRALT